MRNKTSTTRIGSVAEASDGQGAVTNSKAMGSASASASASATRTGMLRKVTTRRFKIKQPVSGTEEVDDAHDQLKRARVVSKDPSSSSMKEVQKMGVGLKRGGIQTEEVTMVVVKKKLERGMSTAGKKEHLAALQAQVKRHDERIQMLQNLLRIAEKERKQKLDEMKRLRAQFR